MLINLRVKTLDSQDHEFSVENDLTVRQFKERIKEKTGIEPDLQRLIYCGRVMNDEHPLSDYDVNGKVVHLVQRPPPGSTPRAVSGSNNNNNADSANRRNSDNPRNSPFFRAIDGMVLGAMAIPMNTNSGTTQSITHSMNPSSTLCMNRITVARHMLNCANNIANYLENPERGLNNTDMDILSQQTMESTVFEVGISAVSDADVPQQDVQNLVQAFQGAVSAAFRQNGLSNITVDPESGTAQATLPIILGAGPIQISTEPSTSSSASASSSSSSSTSSSSSSSSSTTATTTEAPKVTATPTPTVTPTPTATNSTETSSTSTSTSATSNSAPSTPRRTQNAQTSTDNPEGSQNGSNQTTSPQTLAEVVQQMRTVQTRLDPFIQQYYDILQNDPAFSEGDTAARDSAQRVFDRVSEALHYFSHAQHAISDLMLDLSITAPRHLCCRPILVEQSAFVSSGFAVPNFVPFGRRADPSSNNNEASATNNNTAQAATNTASPPTSGTETPTATSNSGQTQTGTTGPATLFGAGSPNNPRQLQVARLIQAVVNSVPANADVHVEINQNPRSQEPHFEIQHVAVSQQQQAQQPPQQQPQQQQQTPTAGSGNNNASQEQEVVFRIDLDGTTPRVTTATHPTTSTQTRSTARPQGNASAIPTAHIRNLRPVPIPAMQLSSFDRYLPCNSHHIREPEDRQPRGQQIHIQRTPQFHIQRPQGTPNRFVNVAAGANRRGPLFATAGPRGVATSTATNLPVAATLITPPPTQSEITSPIRPSIIQSTLNDVAMDTPVPIFGTDRIQLQIRDFVNISPPPSTLNRIRGDLRQYIESTLCLETPITDGQLSMAINQVITFVDQFLLLLPDINIPDYDARASVENLIRRSLPFVLNLINGDESGEFGTRLLREIITFSKRLTVILLHSIGRPGAQEFLKQIIEAVFTSIVAASNDEEQVVDALRWLRRHIHVEICKRFQDIGLDTVDVVEFLVIRRPAPPGQSVTPMETDADDAENADGMATDTNAEEDDPLPSITIGSENWHHNFSQSWLPVITRDMSRQRRQSPQRAFSDAYLSGMSSKRRKLITSSKPTAAEPNVMLGQGIRQIVQQQSRVSRVGGPSSGAASSSASAASTVTSLNEAIASNQHIQEPYGSYEQAILNHVQNRISSDAEFSAERFPNASKWINKNK